ncbi:WPP domain-interacting protein 1-like [Typha angustifolia]|uniref:WPP domain-interacting protein 1-like n=1 Tax=Typha angustifolia TaxID=59011 RepID=UPI003C2C5DDB
MDSEDEGSQSSSREGKERENLEKVGSLGGIEVEGDWDSGTKGRSQIETGDGDKIRGESIENGDEIGGKYSAMGSPSTASAGSNPSPKKGYGLKKWRRIRRDLNKEGSSGIDSSSIHKRRLSLPEPSKGRMEIKEKSDAEDESPAGSVESGIMERPQLAVAPGDLDPDLGLLVAATGFSVGVDSDNSEDRNSRSSTAASGLGRERSRMKSSQQRGPRGRGGVDVGKKSRGSQAKAQVESLHSSVGSDSRTDEAALMRQGSVISNGKQSEMSVNYDGGQTDEGPKSEEGLSAYYEENGGTGSPLREDIDADPQEKNAEKSESSQSDVDPFVQSIVMLQTVQEALESEIQKLVEIGKEPMFDDFDGHYEETVRSNSSSFEAHVVELNQERKHFEEKLEKASASIKAKESIVLELEGLLDRNHLPKLRIESTELQEKCKELEAELDSLIEKKMEAEIECLIMTRTTQSCKLLAEDQIALFEEQKSLANNHMQMMLKLQDTENRAIMLKDQAEKLEAQCKEISGTAEVLKLQNRACKASLFCFIQLIMFCIILGIFFMQLLPQSSEIVPT